jgi:hypothetical protein
MCKTSILRPRLVLMAAVASAFGLFVLTGGCPPMDPGGGTDPNSTGGGATDPNTPSDGDGSTGGGGGGSTGGNPDGTGDPADVNTNGTGGGGGGGGGDSTTPPTALTYEVVAETGGSVPDQAAGVGFTKFGNPVIDSQGRIAFWAQYSGTGAVGNGGLYVYDAGTLSRVVDDDPSVTGIVPGRTTADYFGNYNVDDDLIQDVVWGPGDRLLFVTDISGEKVARGIYRWRATDGDLARVVDLEQVAALFTDAAPNAFDPTFLLPGVSENGLAIFGLSYLYITTSSQFVTGQGSFYTDGTTVTPLADSVLSRATPGNVPDQPTSAFFVEPDTLTTMNADGDALFQSTYGSGDGIIGTYLLRGTETFRVLDDRPGPSWPGLPSGTRFASDGEYVTYALGPESQIAIATELADTSGVRDAVILWSFTSSTWMELTGPSLAPATALLSGVNQDGRVVLLAGDNPYLVGGGTRTQLNQTLPAELSGASLTWSTQGGALNNNNRAAVSYTNGAAAGLAYWTGDRLLVAADVTNGIPTTITGIHTLSVPEEDRPGVSGMLNDADELVFRVELSASAEAIYVARGQ